MLDMVVGAEARMLRGSCWNMFTTGGTEAAELAVITLGLGFDEERSMASEKETSERSGAAIEAVARWVSDAETLETELTTETAGLSLIWVCQSAFGAAVADNFRVAFTGLVSPVFSGFDLAGLSLAGWPVLLGFGKEDMVTLLEMLEVGRGDLVRGGAGAGAGTGDMVTLLGRLRPGTVVFGRPVATLLGGKLIWFCQPDFETVAAPDDLGVTTVGFPSTFLDFGELSSLVTLTPGGNFGNGESPGLVPFSVFCTDLGLWVDFTRLAFGFFTGLLSFFDISTDLDNASS